MAKKIKKSEQESEEKVYGNPEYPAKDDIYSHDQKESFSEDDELSLEERGKSLGDGLDIPGSELDDEDELIVEEDEENNYYSLGGDNHDDLEEDQGD